MRPAELVVCGSVVVRQESGVEPDHDDSDVAAGPVADEEAEHDEDGLDVPLGNAAARHDTARSGLLFGSGSNRCNSNI